MSNVDHYIDAEIDMKFYKTLEPLNLRCIKILLKYADVHKYACQQISTYINYVRDLILVTGLLVFYTNKPGNKYRSLCL